MLLWCVVPARAVVVPLSFDELVTRAEHVFLGRVVDLRARWDQHRMGPLIVTRVVFQVETVYHGAESSTTSIDIVGGTIDDETLTVSDTPTFKIGDRDVLFIAGNQLRGNPIVGSTAGRFRIVRNDVAGTDSVRTHEGRAFRTVQELGVLDPGFGGSAMDLREFESNIRARFAARR
jgi:hypothetical protein